jgi:hypothetical protein
MAFDFMEFIRPNSMKIALALTLLMLSTVLSVNRFGGTNGTLSYSYEQLGFPLSNFVMFNNNSDLILAKDANNLYLNAAMGLAGNIVFWYIVSCFAIFGFGRFTGKGKLGEVQ